MVEEVVLHEVAVALVVVGGQALVLIQIYAADLLEAELALPVPVGQIPVGPHGGGTGSQPQHAGGIVGDLGGDDLSGAAAHGLVVLFHVNSHEKTPF